ncbi:MAG: penicillin-binding protein 1A [Gammaproteobacteria bacterium]
MLFYLLPRLPSIETLKDIHLQVPLKVYSRDLSLLAEFGETRRAPMQLKDLPQTLINAVLAAEDDRFFRHPGVDWRGILRAAIQLLLTGEKIQGGSTITMQVARNFFLTPEKTYVRKISEILLALKIERELTKKEILELYLNKIYFGHRAYGVAAAAHVYYGMNVQNLGLPELAMIAGLPKAPSKLNPITDLERAVARRNFVLRRMRDLEMISKADYRAAKRTKDPASLHGQAVEISASHLAEMARAYMVEHFGMEVYNAGYRVVTTISNQLQAASTRALRRGLLRYDQRHGYRGPEQRHALSDSATEAEWTRILQGYSSIGDLRAALVIAATDKSITAFTLDVGLITINWGGLAWASNYTRAGAGVAKRARDILAPGDVVRIEAIEKGGFRLAQVPAAEGAFVALDPRDGAILALVGGFDFSQSKFNRVTQARRLAGSGFKPFIYSAALVSGYTAASIVNDSPFEFYDPALNRVWRPENYTHNYMGPMRLREALALSRNTVSVRLLQSIGVNKAVNHIKRFGFDKAYVPRNLSLALGTAEVTPLELARGYVAFANGGFRVDPYFIERIENDRGEIIMSRGSATQCESCDEQAPAVNALTETAERGVRALSAQNAWIMTSMMQEVIRTGTGKAALSLNRTDIAGKTGTTNDHKDTWFSGFNHQIVATAWVGFDQAKSLGPKETGARVALPIWMEFMQTALAGIPDSMAREPPGLVTVRIDRDTGLLTDTDNPRAMFEVFRADNTPSEYDSGAAWDIGVPDSAAQPEQLF